MAATAVATRVALCVTAGGVWGQADDGRVVTGSAAGLWEIVHDFGVPIAVEVGLPSHWGPLRRRAFEDRLRQVAGDVVVRPVSVVAAEMHIDNVGLPTRHVVVVEVSARTATATLVGVRPDATRIVGCEHRARVGAAELVDVVRGLVDVVLGDRMPDAVLVLGADDDVHESFDGVGGSIDSGAFGRSSQLVGRSPGPAAVPVEPSEPADVWPAPLPRVGSVGSGGPWASRPPSSRRPVPLR